MPEIILNCPQCQRQLRVTEELQGRPVKCPACGLTFTVPPGSAEPEPVLDVRDAAGFPPQGQAPLPREQGLIEDYDEEHRPRRRARDGGFEPGDRDRARSLVLAPAICLIGASSLGLLLDLYEVVSWATAPEARMQQVEQFNKFFNLPLPNLQQMGSLMVATHAAFAGLCVVIIVFAIQMMRLRWYPMAMVGSILPMMNLGSNCCCLGLPIGIWALIILLRADVREAFYSNRPS
jgi:predicted Zn finger-like uncharacterized protein